MKRFRKGYNFKIISFLIGSLVLFNSLIYALPCSLQKENLRIPLLYGFKGSSTHRNKKPAQMLLRKIHVPQITLSEGELKTLRRWMQEKPKQHLIRCSPNQLIERIDGKHFSGFDPLTIKLTYNVGLIKKERQSEYILIISEMSQGNERPLYNWAITDDRGNFVALRNHKISTLPSQFVERPDDYERLSVFTYRWKIDNNVSLNINEGYFFKEEGEPWIEYPVLVSDDSLFFTQKSVRGNL